MKHRLIYHAFIILSFLCARCVPVIEDVFDRSAAERIAERQKELRLQLVSATNGWLLDYYPDKKAALGGYAMFVNFHADGYADVACERETHLPAGQFATSTYDIIADQSVVLTFNTYNKVLHFFSEPVGSSDVDGLAGDHEFVLMDIAADRVEFIGKKWGQRLVMRRCAADFDFLAYIAAVEAKVEVLSYFSMFSFHVDGEQLAVATVTDRSFNVTYYQVDGTDSTELTTKVPYIVTEQGVRLIEPFEIPGSSTTIENLAWNNDEERYTCLDPGVNFEAMQFFPADYELQYEEFIGRWHMTCTGYSGPTTYTDTVEIAFKKKNASYTLTFPVLFPLVSLEVTFNALKGTITIANQLILVTPEGNHFRNALYNSTANNSYPAAGSYGLKGVWNHDQDGIRKITLDNDGRASAVGIYGFLLRTYAPNSTTAATGSTTLPDFSSGNYLGTTSTYGTTNYRFYNFILTKLDD